MACTTFSRGFSAARRTPCRGVTQGHQWIIRPEIHDDAKTSPFIVQQDAVGLQAVGDDFVTTVTLLELDHLCKKSSPHKVGSPPCQQNSTFCEGVDEMVL